jgi:glycosyltransferase involved in cell wall biosynthesis
MGSPCAGPAGTENRGTPLQLEVQTETTDSRAPGRRLLIITYYFPPETSVGAHRWRAMSRWLRRLGHEVTVLTTPAFGTLPDEAEETERAFDLAASPALRRLLRRPPVSRPHAGEPQMGEGAPPAIVADLLVPDAHVVGWNPAAAWAARRLVRQRRIDCVITSSPPHSTHLIPFALGRRRPAWIADFRDGWRFEPLRSPWPLPGQDALDGWLERRVAARADLLIGVTRPIADDLAGRLGARSACITNAWDPDLDASVANANAPLLDPETINIVHAGKLYIEGSNRRDPSTLGPALRLLLDRRPEAAERLRILLAGPLDPEEQRYIAELDPAEMIRHLGHLPRDDMLALERKADALLLVTAPELVSLATGKLFEYLAAGRPIIALAHGNEAARIVEETGTGVTMSIDDAEGLAGAFEAALDGKLSGRYAPHDFEPYVYPAPARELAEQVERAIAERTGVTR